MQRDDALAEHQSEPRTRRLGREKWREELLQFTLSEPSPTIHNFNAQKLTPFALGREAELGLHPGADANPPVVIHRFERIADEIDDGAFQRWLIADNIREAVIELLLQLDF